MNSRKIEVLPMHTSIGNCMDALDYYFPKNDGVCFGASWLFLIVKYMDDLKLNTADVHYWVKIYRDRLDYIKRTLQPLIQEIKEDLQNNEFIHVNNLDECSDDAVVKAYHLKIQTRLENIIGQNALNELKTFFDPLYIIADPLKHTKLFKKKFLFDLMMRCKSDVLKSLQLSDTMDSIYNNRHMFFSNVRTRIIYEMQQHPHLYSYEDYTILINYLIYLERQDEISFDNFKNIAVPQSEIEVNLSQELTKNLVFEKMKIPNIKLVKNIINVYTYQKLYSFLQLLLLQLKRTPLPISLGFIVSNNFHATAMAANPRTIANGYLHFDVDNDVADINNENIVYLNDLDVCTDYIIASFKDQNMLFNENNTLVLGFSFYCPAQYFNQLNEFIDILKSKGVENITLDELNQRDVLGESYLDLVADFNDIGLANTILPYCRHLVNDLDSEGSTPLNTACEKNRFYMANLLLQNGADPNVATERGTPLTSAAGFGFFDIVQLLLRYGAKINQPSSRILPIVSAAAGKYFDIALLLAKNDVEKGYLNTTVIYHAVRYNNITALDFFIKNDCSVNIGVNGVTPLHLAVRNNNREVVEILLQAGAAINDATPDGETPLYVAAKNGNDRIVKLLVEYGANLNLACPIQSQQPFHVSTKVSLAANQNMTLFQFIHEAKTPLEVAKELNHTYVVRYLEAVEYQQDMDWEEQFITNRLE